MIRIATLSTFLCMLFLSPFTFADNHVVAESQSLATTKNKMIDKSGKSMSKSIDKEKGGMKDKRKQIEKKMPCSERGKEHGECDKIKEKMEPHKNDKDKIISDKKQASTPDETRVLTSIYISSLLLKHLKDTGIGNK